MNTLSVIDAISLVWFAMVWVTYSIVADHTGLKRRTIAHVMNEYRVHWMVAMLQRELRIIDTSIVGNILHGVAFFASTSILLVGGLIAGLGAGEQAIAVLAELPASTPTTMASWELKVLLLIGIFIYAFFKLAWAFRLFVNCSVLIGAAPLPPVPEAVVESYARHSGRALSLASAHYNAGLRAYFFALAAIWWMLNPLAFLIATTVVLVVLSRREFNSRTLKTISAGLPDSASPGDVGAGSGGALGRGS